MPKIHFYLPRKIPLFEESGIGDILRPKGDNQPLLGTGVLTVSEPKVYTCGDGTSIVAVCIESEMRGKGFYFNIDVAGLRKQFPNAPIAPSQGFII